jgi:hypothetical protein
MNDAVNAMLPYLTALCDLVETLKVSPSPALAREALVEAECVVAALTAYLFREAMKS